MKTSNVSPSVPLAIIAGHVADDQAASTGGITVEFEDESGPLPATILRVANYTDNGGGDVSLLPQIVGDGTGTITFSTGTETIIIANTAGTIRVDESTGFIRMMAADGSSGVLVNTAATTVALWGGHVPGALAGEGVNIEVGEDFVGIYISERDSSTIQIYDDAGGAYDIEFVEQSASFHFKFVASDAGVAIPSLGMLPQYSSAPSSPVLGQSYFDTGTNIAYTWNGSTWKAWWA